MILVPLMSWPVVALSVALLLVSIVLSGFILVHKNRGGGMSDLFGGGMSTSMGGTSMAERNLDRLTIIMGLIWLALIIALLAMYRYVGI